MLVEQVSRRNLLARPDPLARPDLQARPDPLELLTPWPLVTTTSGIAAMSCKAVACTTFIAADWTILLISSMFLFPAISSASSLAATPRSPPRSLPRAVVLSGASHHSVP